MPVVPGGQPIRRSARWGAAAVRKKEAKGAPDHEASHRDPRRDGGHIANSSSSQRAALVRAECTAKYRSGLINKHAHRPRRTPCRLHGNAPASVRRQRRCSWSRTGDIGQPGAANIPESWMERTERLCTARAAPHQIRGSPRPGIGNPHRRSTRPPVQLARLAASRQGRLDPAPRPLPDQ